MIFHALPDPPDDSDEDELSPEPEPVAESGRVSSDDPESGVTAGGVYGAVPGAAGVDAGKVGPPPKPGLTGISGAPAAPGLNGMAANEPGPTEPPENRAPQCGHTA